MDRRRRSVRFTQDALDVSFIPHVADDTGMEVEEDPDVTRLSDGGDDILPDIPTNSARPRGGSIGFAFRRAGVESRAASGRESGRPLNTENISGSGAGAGAGAGAGGEGLVDESFCSLVADAARIDSLRQQSLSGGCGARGGSAAHDNISYNQEKENEERDAGCDSDDNDLDITSMSLNFGSDNEDDGKDPDATSMSLNLGSQDEFGGDEPDTTSMRLNIDKNECDRGEGAGGVSNEGAGKSGNGVGFGGGSKVGDKGASGHYSDALTGSIIIRKSNSSRQGESNLNLNVSTERCMDQDRPSGESFLTARVPCRIDRSHLDASRLSNNIYCDRKEGAGGFGSKFVGKSVDEVGGGGGDKVGNKSANGYCDDGPSADRIIRNSNPARLGETMLDPVLGVEQCVDEDRRSGGSQTARLPCQLGVDTSYFNSPLASRLDKSRMDASRLNISLYGHDNDGTDDEAVRQACDELVDYFLTPGSTRSHESEASVSPSSQDRRMTYLLEKATCAFRRLGEKRRSGSSAAAAVTMGIDRVAAALRPETAEVALQCTHYAARCLCYRRSHQSTRNEQEVRTAALGYLTEVYGRFEPDLTFAALRIPATPAPIASGGADRSGAFHFDELEKHGTELIKPTPIVDIFLQIVLGEQNQPEGASPIWTQRPLTTYGTHQSKLQNLAIVALSRGLRAAQFIQVSSSLSILSETPIDSALGSGMGLGLNNEKRRSRLNRAALYAADALIRPRNDSDGMAGDSFGANREDLDVACMGLLSALIRLDITEWLHFEGNGNDDLPGTGGPSKRRQSPAVSTSSERTLHTRGNKNPYKHNVGPSTLNSSSSHSSHLERLVRSLTARAQCLGSDHICSSAEALQGNFAMSLLILVEMKMRGAPGTRYSGRRENDGSVIEPSALGNVLTAALSSGGKTEDSLGTLLGTMWTTEPDEIVRRGAATVVSDFCLAQRTGLFPDVVSFETLATFLDKAWGIVALHDDSDDELLSQPVSVVENALLCLLSLHSSQSVSTRRALLTYATNYEAKICAANTMPDTTGNRLEVESSLRVNQNRGDNAMEDLVQSLLYLSCHVSYLGHGHYAVDITCNIFEAPCHI